MRAFCDARVGCVWAVSAVIGRDDWDVMTVERESGGGIVGEFLALASGRSEYCSLSAIARLEIDDMFGDTWDSFRS